MGKTKTKIRLNPKSTYHAILVKKYGIQGALKELRRSNLAYILEHTALPKSKLIKRFAFST